MQLVLFLVIAAVIALFAVWFANTYFKARISQELMAEGKAFEIGGEDYALTLLVLGDSTAIGVGTAHPEYSVPGRLAGYLHATYVENHADIGAGVDDLPGQIAAATRTHYDYTLIMIGSNDIISFRSAKEKAARLADLLPTLPASGTTFLMSAGNVGGATLFPPFVRPFHTMVTQQFHAAFQAVADAHGIHYINLYEPFWKDPFLRDPRRYLSRDGLHPSRYGYGIWFGKLQEVLEQK